MDKSIYIVWICYKWMSFIDMKIYHKKNWTWTGNHAGRNNNCLPLDSNIAGFLRVVYACACSCCCVYRCMYTCMYMCVEARGWYQASFLSSSTCIFDTVSTTVLGEKRLDKTRYDGQQAPMVLLSLPPRARVTGMLSCLSFYTDAQNPCKFGCPCLPNMWFTD